MSVADKDGRIAQALFDRLACLSISMHESVREGAAEVERLLTEIDEDDA